eukprot:4717588-Pyramimonas_sp.AAC.2
MEAVAEETDTTTSSPHTTTESVTVEEDNAVWGVPWEDNPYDDDPYTTSADDVAPVETDTTSSNAEEEHLRDGDDPHTTSADDAAAEETETVLEAHSDGDDDPHTTS